MSFFSRYRINIVSLVLTIAVTVLFLGIGLSRLGIETDILKTLPMDDPIVSDAGYIFKNHPFHDLVVIDVGMQKGDPDRLVEAGLLVEKKLLASGLFRKVGTRETQNLIPELIYHIVDNLPVMFTREELENQIQPLLKPDRIHQQLSDSFSQLTGMEGIGQAEFISKDPMGLRNIVLAKLAHLAPSRGAHFYQGQLVSSDWKHLLIIANPVKPGTDTGFSRQVTALIHTISSELDQMSNHSGIKFTLTPVGAFRAALDNETAIKKDVGNSTTLATIGIAFLLIFSFPRPLIGLMSLLPSICGTITAFFLFSFFYDSISLISLGFGGALISITVDYGIAYFLFLDRPYETTGKKAAEEVRAAGLLATLTTVGAFLALSFSGFPILLQIGQFAALGIASSFVFVHTVLPLIFPVMPPARRKGPLPMEKFANRLATFGGRYKAYAAGGFAVIMLFFAWPRFHVDLSSLNSVSKETIAAENQVTGTWGQIFNKIYLMTEGKNASVLQMNSDKISSLLEQEVQAGVFHPTFLPSMVFPGEQRGKENFKAWKQFWNQNSPSGIQTQIQKTGQEIGFSEDAFQPFFSQLSHGKYQETRIPEKFYSLFGISKGQKNSGLILFTSLNPGSSYQAESFFERFHQTGLVKIFDSTLFSDRLGNLLSSTFLRMLWMVGFSVLFLLIPFFMNWRLTAVSLLPILFAFICTLGTMNIMGEPLGIPGLLISIVILGMGIDYSLYLIRASQRYLDESHPYQGQIRMTVLLASVSTLMGFGALSLSEHSLLRSIGVSSLLGIGYSVIGAFAILPPILKHLFRPIPESVGMSTMIPGSLKHRRKVMSRYQYMETFPRMFAWFKMKLDPMFPDLAELVGSARTIIDIGCGYGIPAAWLLEILPGARVYGIEPDMERVRIAKRALGSRGVIVSGTAPDIPNPSVLADIAVMLDMVHYLNDEEFFRTLENLRKQLRNDGRLLIRVTIPMKERPPWFRWVETLRLGFHKIESHYRPADDIRRIIQKAGFDLRMMKPSASGREETWFMAEVA
ncbi:MAG: MMPL family protein, partial [Desulfobacterium sp.]|nr:MMPL family protein [Desulfobacterium sp.]